MRKSVLHAKKILFLETLPLVSLFVYDCKQIFAFTIHLFNFPLSMCCSRSPLLQNVSRVVLSINEHHMHVHIVKYLL